jgi:mevalonate pyrophosphate decarboxylase
VKALLAATLARDPARATSEARVDSERAEAAFYTGLDAWSRGDDVHARVHFERCRGFRALDLMENGLAEALLAGPPKLVLPKDRVIP